VQALPSARLRTLMMCTALCFLPAGLCCCCLASCRIAATRAAARRWSGAGAGGFHPQLRLPALCQPGRRGRPCCGAGGRQPAVLKVPSGLVLWHRLLACRLAGGASAGVQGAGGGEAGGAGTCGVVRCSVCLVVMLWESSLEHMTCKLDFAWQEGAQLTGKAQCREVRHVASQLASPTSEGLLGGGAGSSGDRGKQHRLLCKSLLHKWCDAELAASRLCCTPLHAAQPAAANPDARLSLLQRTRLGVTYRRQGIEKL
jgi:hypothetical protein